MKVRTMFVSNSSSSSSIVLVKQETFDQAIKSFDRGDDVKKFIEDFFEKDKVFGVDVRVFCSYSTPGGDMWEWADVSEYDLGKDSYGDNEYPGEIVGAFINACLKINKEDVYDKETMDA